MQQEDTDGIPHRSHFCSSNNVWLQSSMIRKTNNSNNLASSPKCRQRVQNPTAGSLLPVNIPSPCAPSTDDDWCPIVLLIFHRLPALTCTRHQAPEELATLAIRVRNGVVKIRRGEGLTGRADAAENARAHGPSERRCQRGVGVTGQRGVGASERRESKGRGAGEGEGFDECA